MKDQIENKIRELVPSLQELSFGCEISIPPREDMIGTLPELKTRIVKTLDKEGVAYALENDITIDISNAKTIGHPIQLNHHK